MLVKDKGKVNCNCKLRFEKHPIQGVVLSGYVYKLGCHNIMITICHDVILDSFFLPERWRYRVAQLGTQNFVVFYYPGNGNKVAQLSFNSVLCMR